MSDLPDDWVSHLHVYMIEITWKDNKEIRQIQGTHTNIFKSDVHLLLF